MELLLLALLFVVCLLLVPLGLPGLWAMLGVALLYDWLGTGPDIGIWAVLAGAVVAALAELLEYMLSARFARRYGGSRRAEWGAILGGMIGAIMGLPVPIVGSVLGAFAGAFIGALVGELSRGSGTRVSGRAAWGAFLGRIAAVAVKIALGCLLAVWLFFMAWA